MPRLPRLPKPVALAASLVVAGAAGALLIDQLPLAQAQAPRDRAERRPAEVISADRVRDLPSTEAGARTIRTVSLEQAETIVAAARAQAARMDLKMDIAVVDAGANLKAFQRMDGAWLGSVDIAIKKAKTARMFDMPTGDIGELSQPGKPLYMIEMSNGGLITFPGGVPLKSADGEVIGAIGVSGSSVENDHAVATAGAEALR